MIFAREVNDPLASLVKKLDAEVAKQGQKKMAAFVVLLTEDDAAETKLKEMAEKNGIKNVSLALDKPAGPYKKDAAVNPEADVTAVLYVAHSVKANHAFKKGEFSEAGVEQVVADLPKILNAAKDSKSKGKEPSKDKDKDK